MNKRATLIAELETDAQVNPLERAWGAANRPLHSKNSSLVSDSVILKPRGAFAPQWDSFWVKQSQSRGVVDTLIWVARAVFSRKNAKQLLNYASLNDSNLWEGFRFLEVGCGSASTSDRIANMWDGSRGYAIDLSFHATKLARLRNKNLNCVVADASHLPFVQNCFALCFSSGVIEHFDRQYAHFMVRESCRVTQQGCTLGIVVPWKHSPYNLLRIICGHRWPFGYEDPFSKRGLNTFAMQLGLSHIEIVSSYGTTLTALGRRAI